MSPDLLLLDTNIPGGRRRLDSTSTGTLNRGFSETREVLFSKVGEDWNLFIDDVPLESAHRDGQDVWLWSPGFYAGTVRAELIRGQDKTGVCYLLDVSPDPQKVGQQHFEEMVGEVWDFDPVLVIGDESAMTGIGELGDRGDPAVRYMRLSSHADALVSSSSAIAREPHRSLRAARRHVPLYRVQRADVQTATAAMMGEAASLFVENEGDEGGRQGERQPLFDVPVSEQTFDSAPNRTMAALLSLVVQSIDNVSAVLQLQITNESDEETKQGLSQRWPRRHRLLGDLRHEIQRVLDRDPFNSVTRKEITAAGLTAIAAHPLYAHTQQLIWKMIRPGYEGGPKTELSAMSPTWAIYESWCFVTLSTFLKKRYPDWRWTRSNAGFGRYRVLGKSGQRSVSLHLQQVFSYSATPPESGMWSVSSQLIPDIVLVVCDGDRSSWMILDAKYRRNRRNILDGMRSAHLYRDALRRFANPPSMSLLLIPAPAEDAAWLLTEEFRKAHGVGALVCSPARLDKEAVEVFLGNFFDGA